MEQSYRGGDASAQRTSALANSPPLPLSILLQCDPLDLTPQSPIEAHTAPEAFLVLTTLEGLYSALLLVACMAKLAQTAMGSTAKNTTHLKHGNTFPDPHATAKAQGKHFSTAPKHHAGADGKLGQPNTPNRP